MQNRYADFFPAYTNSIAARGFLLCCFPLYESAVTFHDFHVGKGSGPLHGQADSYITCKTVARIFLYFFPHVLIQLQLPDFFSAASPLYKSAVIFHDFYVSKRSRPFHGQSDSYITCKTVTRIFFPCTLIQLQLADFFSVTDQLLPSTTSTSGRGVAHFMARLTHILHTKLLRGFFFRVH